VRDFSVLGRGGTLLIEAFRIVFLYYQFCFRFKWIFAGIGTIFKHDCSGFHEELVQSIGLCLAPHLKFQSMKLGVPVTMLGANLNYNSRNINDYQALPTETTFI
jgi:hypothetical protein